MDRIDHPTAVLTRPEYEVLEGSIKGFAQGANLAKGQKATKNLASQYNAIQETLMHTIETAKLQGDHADDTLLTQAIQKLSDVGTLKTDVTNNTAAIQSLNSGFENLSSTTGYTKLPNGLIIQWGNSTSSSATITFPVSFTESVYSITGAINGISARTGNDSDSGFMAYSVSLTNFSGRIGRVFQNTPWSWIAIGK